MKITVLGSGSAFTMKNYQSNYLVESDDGKSNLLIDCGSDIRFALRDMKLSYKDIQNIYISHLHADHCGGMEYMAFCSFFDSEYGKLFPMCEVNEPTDKPHLYGQSTLLSTLWGDTLKGGLGSIEGREMDLSDYFYLHKLSVNRPARIRGIGSLQIVQTVHIMNGYGIVPTFGVIITDKETGKNIYFTTDTQFSPDQIGCFYNQSDLIIQDCEISAWESKVHAHYNKLNTLSSDVKKKMWLTHYGDNFFDGDYGEWRGDIANQKKAKKDGFLGFLQKGQVIIA